MPDTDPGPSAEAPAPIEAAPTHVGLGEVDAWAGWPPPSGEQPRGRLALLLLRGAREALDLAVLVAAFFLVFQFAVANYQVDGTSMLPTFQNGDRLVVNRLIYRLTDPEPGEVVVLHGQGGADLLKRVVAIEGQRVRVEDGVVFVDGVPLEEPYLAEPPAQPLDELVVPEGHVFVMGDNRNRSHDSRAFGPVPVSEIVGRADVRYLPMDAFGLVDHADY